MILSLSLTVLRSRHDDSDLKDPLLGRPSHPSIVSSTAGTPDTAPLHRGTTRTFSSQVSAPYVPIVGGQAKSVSELFRSLTRFEFQFLSRTDFVGFLGVSFELFGVLWGLVGLVRPIISHVS